MLRLSSAILIAVLVCAVSNAGILAGNNLKFLGKFTSVSPTRNDRQARTQTSFYFLSQNAVAWTTANSECKDFLSDAATLVNIETPQELIEIQSYLDSWDETDSSFWTSGRYSDGKFVWENGTEIDPSLWDVGHPDSRTPATRVLAHRRAERLILRTDFQTASYRYICELII